MSGTTVKAFSRAAMVALGVLLVAVTTAARDNWEPQLALWVDAQNQLHAYYKPCHDDTRILSVQVESLRRDTPYWLISSQEGSMVREFVAGVTPDGFEEVQPLVQQFGEERLHIHFRVLLRDSRESSDDEFFNLSELRADRVLVPRRGVMTLEEFLKRSTCEPRGWLG